MTYRKAAHWLALQLVLVAHWLALHLTRCKVAIGALQWQAAPLIGRREEVLNAKHHVTQCKVVIDSLLHTQQNLFWILRNQIEFQLYLPFSD